MKTNNSKGGMMHNNIRIVLEQKNSIAIKQGYKSLNSVATRIVLSWPQLRKDTLDSLTGITDNKILCFLVDVISSQRGVEPSKIYTSIILKMIKDACRYEKKHLYWDLKKQDELLGILTFYTPIQRFFLVDWADQFDRTKQKNIQVYVNRKWVVNQ